MHVGARKFPRQAARDAAAWAKLIISFISAEVY